MEQPIWQSVMTEVDDGYMLRCGHLHPRLRGNAKTPKQLICGLCRTPAPPTPMHRAPQDGLLPGTYWPKSGRVKRLTR